MTLKNLLKNLNYELIQGNDDIEVSDIIYDSRKVVPGTVFVCLEGYNSDGHTYAQDALNKGAAALVVSKSVETDNEDATIIKVDDTREALALMSAEFFGNPAKSLKTVAVTGTKGKTTTVAMIKSILDEDGIKTGTIGTLGIIIGDKLIKTNNTTPESYEVEKAMRQMVDEGCKAMVIEASSLGLKWHRIDGITFDIGVFTNFSDDHIGDSEHKDLAEYLYCKSLLFKKCAYGIANCDDPAWKKVTENAVCPIETFGYSENADLRAFNDRLISQAGFIGVHFETDGIARLSPDVSIPGKFNVYNAVAAIAVCLKLGVSREAVLAGLKKAKVKGRVEIVDVPGNYTLLIDYAHNAVSMENVLSTLRQYNPNRLITMFGAGGNRPKVRRYEMGEISGKMSDLSVITEDNSRFEDVMDIIEDIKTGINKTDGKYVVVPNRKDAIRYCMENARDGDIVVLAGKGHEDYQEIKGVKYHLDEREVIADIVKDMDGK